MLILDAIVQSVALTGQVVEDATLVRWLSELDGRLAFEFYRVETWTPYDPVLDIGCELLIPYPWDGLYLHHLEAMTYYTAGEYDRYENARAMTEKKLAEFRAYMQRTQAPLCGVGFPTDKIGGGGPHYDQWATDSWQTIRAVSLAGLTGAAYGDQVGDTRDIVLSDGTTATIRLCNATTDMYDRSNGHGKTGLVMEFVDVLMRDYMTQSSTNTGGWDASLMRKSIMPRIYRTLPQDLQDVIETVSIVTSSGGTDSVLVTSQDKLFLMASSEIFGEYASYDLPLERAALKQYQYYLNAAQSRRVKYFNGIDWVWWTRSPSPEGLTSWCIVGNTGITSFTSIANETGVSPAFCI